LLIPGVRIPVDTIKVPIYIYIGHGDQDQVWGHDRSERIVELRQIAELSTKLRVIAGEGHVFSKDASAKEFAEIADFFSEKLKS
jgi:dipeptidyl aminopeptidase/acylaminoacyl peptidase